MNFNDPLLYAIPAFLLCIIIEWILDRYYHAREPEHNYEVKDFLGSIGTGVGVILLSPLAKVIGFFILYLVFNGTMQLRLQLLGYDSLDFVWWVWIVAFLADDLTFYWHHRICHTVRIFWADHIAHHSSKHYNFGTGIRNSWGIMFYKVFFWIWMPLLGFHPLMIVTVMSISGIYQFLLHTKYIPRIPVLEKFINTPVLHQVHHACNLKYLDKNHGGVLIIWDKLFGTFVDYDLKQLPQFGVPKEPGSHNPLRIVSHEYVNMFYDIKRARSFKDKLKYIFYPPGWSHDGSTETTRQKQKCNNC
jgi:sterol desaturase/sphingolipid hydroxylase (fatty acid hydroxylase superfamily)